MAVVKSGRTRNGAHYRVLDDAYANITPEEDKRRRAHINEVTYNIQLSVARAKLEEQQSKRNSSPT